MIVPEWLQPMAATLTQERFTAPGWVFERKIDGIRLLAFKHGSNVRLFSRNHLPQDHAYPSFAAAVAALPVGDSILDGEATWHGHGELAYHLFDAPWLDGQDLTGEPLRERRRVLETLPLAPPLRLVQRVSGDAPWEHACREGWEGVIAKRENSRYEQRRSRDWLKMKCELTRDMIVGGFTSPRGSRQGLGALLVGHFEGEDFVFAGRVGTGFTTAMLLDLRERLDALVVDRSPFTRATGLPRDAHWVTPSVVVRVAFMEWTSHGKMRHPRLLAISPERVTAELPGAPP